MLLVALLKIFTEFRFFSFFILKERLKERKLELDKNVNNLINFPFLNKMTKDFKIIILNLVIGTSSQVIFIHS